MGAPFYAYNAKSHSKVYEKVSTIKWHSKNTSEFIKIQMIYRNGKNIFPTLTTAKQNGYILSYMVISSKSFLLAVKTSSCDYKRRN